MLKKAVVRGKNSMEFWGALRLVAKFIGDFFMGKYKERKHQQEKLNTFFIEISDIRDKAVEYLSILASEHNRRNDPSVRAGRKLNEYGPASSPFKLELVTLRKVFEDQYEKFTTNQRDGIKQLLALVDDYNMEVTELHLKNDKMYIDLGWDFAVKPAAHAASITFLAAKLVELRERFQFDESETSTSAINKVLNAYKIYMHNVTFEEVP